MIEITENLVEQITSRIIDELKVKDNKESLQIPVEQRLTLIKDYRMLPEYGTYDNPLTLLNNETLDEGIVRTYPLDRTLTYVKDYFGFDDTQIKIIKGQHDKDKIRILFPNVNDNLEEIKKKLDYCGYFLSFPTEEEIKKHINEWIWVNFEPRFPNNETEEIKKAHRYLYHLTPLYNLKKIQSQGFVPKSKNAYLEFPSRVYFTYDEKMTETNQITNDVFYLGKVLYSLNKSKGNDGKYVLLTIDTAKIDDNVELHLDPNYKYGCFTNDNVNPDCIINVREIDYNR